MGSTSVLGFWIAAAILTLIALGALLRPLIRPPKPNGAEQDFERRLYRARLAELERDEASGAITGAEAEAAQAELARRLLDRSDQPQVSRPVSSPLARRLTALALIGAVPALAITLYIGLGADGRPDDPLASRSVERSLLGQDGRIDPDKARLALESRLKEHPDSLEGWLLLARTDAGLGRDDEMSAAFERALALTARRADILETYGEALTARANNVVTPAAKALFEEAVAKEPTAVAARYDLALARAQSGDAKGAIADWQALAASAPPNADWLPTVQASIAEAQRQLAGTPDPPGGQEPKSSASALSPEQLAAVRGMVSGLAERLAAQPDDLAGWIRLGRSYRVLGDSAASAAAYRHAATLAPQDADLALAYAQTARARDGDHPTPETLAAYRTLLALRPDQPEALWELGDAARTAGNLDEAAALWRHVIATEPADSAAAARAARGLAEIGRAAR